MSEQVIKDMESHMSKSVEVLREKLSKVRTGRASISMLDDIHAEAYGSEMPLNQLATLGVPEPRTLTVQPWDKSLIPAIEKAIQKSPHGLQPSTQGDVIRIPIPALTEERRKEYSKHVKSLGEEARVAVRNVRRDAKSELERLKKDGELPEDDFHKLQDRMQKSTSAYEEKISDLVDRKEKDIMEV